MGNAMAMMAVWPLAVVSFAGEAGQLLWRTWAGGWRFASVGDFDYFAGAAHRLITGKTLRQTARN